jgi:hypothetical protein
MRVRIAISSDYSGQTEAKLLADVKPALDRWMSESINQGAMSLEKSKPEESIYMHVSVQNTEHAIDGEPVLVFLLVYLSGGAAPPEVICHLGSEENVRAREAKYRDFMKEMAARDKRSSLLQIDNQT